MALGRTPPYVETRLAFVPREKDPEKVDVVALWEGDAGFEAGDAALPGARHRLNMGEGPWSYDRSQGVPGLA
jgi:hypothetical protein